MNKKIKFNVLDFVIILLSILVILSVVFWNDIRLNFIQDERTAEYTFTVNGITEEVLSAIKVEDKVFVSEDGTEAGTIKSIESKKETLSVELTDGSSKYYEADTYTVSGKITVKGVIKENGFYIGDKYFVVSGKRFNVYTSRINMNIEVDEIKY